MTNVGERIRARREELGMTQEELAKKLGYKSRASVAKIEANANFMTRTKLLECSKALQCSTSWLLDGSEEHVPATSLSPNQEEMLGIMTSLSEEDQLQLLGMARFMYYKKLSGTPYEKFDTLASK